MSTAAGWDAPTSCASFRAGIARAEELDYADYFAEEECELEPIIGYAACGRALECEGLGKMVALGIDPLRQVLSTSAGDARARTGLFIALPNYSLRQESFTDVNAQMSIRGPSEAELARKVESDEDPLASLRFADECNRYLQERLFRAAGAPANVVVQHNFYGDRAALLFCLRAAFDTLRSGTAERCIVGAIDSFLEPDTLDWALTQGRLKIPGVPCGFLPGEAAVFLELRRASDTVEGMLVSDPEMADEVTRDRNEGEPGAAMARAISSALSRGAGSAAGVAIGDLNGEYQRAMEWGCALNRLVRRFPYLQTVSQWQPAEAFGETGCASTALAIAVAMHAFRRQYAGTDQILVWCSSDDGIRGALVVRWPK